MIGKKINQLATELAPVSTDLTIIGDPISGVSKKITLAQLGAIFSGAVSFYTDLASFPATGDINVIYCAKDTQKLYLWSGSAYVEVFPSQALLDTYQLRSEKGNANGYASLDSGGKVPISQLPSSIMEYKGTWNASTNTPTLANGTGDTGDVYICNVAGTVNFGAGAIAFAVGDYVIYSGSIWQRSSGAVGTVTSVALTVGGDAISVSGSPLTTSGTLGLTFNGTTAQYIRGNGTLETFPTLTGFVPYTGATANVNLGTFDLTADVITGATGSYTSSGGGNTLEVTHSSGSGIALNITKGGNGEGLYINKTSGSGNAATIIGTLNATTLVKSGGTSAQFLKADGSVDSNTYVTIDTFETITASKNFALGLSLGSAGGTNQASVFQNTSSLFSGSAGVNVFGFNSANNIYFGKGSDNGGVLQWSNSTVRYYTLPNATGTLALTSDLTGGTVTSVGLSSATSGVTIGSTPITTSGTITLAIATASGSQQGLLSSTDWTTFNNKQNALTNPVTGTGTTNYLPKFTGASTIGNSSLQDDGSNVFLSNGYYISTRTDNTSVLRTHLLMQRGSGAGTYADIFTAGDTANGVASMQFGFNSSAKMILTASGNLSIGNTNDTYKLDVTGTGRFTGSLRSTSGDIRSINTGSNTAGSGAFYLLGDTTGTNFFINQLNASNGIDWYYYNGSYSSSLFRLASTGAATFSSSVTSTAPANALLYKFNGRSSDNMGQLLFYANNGSTLYSFMTSYSSEFILGTVTSIPLSFYTNNTESMRIKSGGDIGIGTAGQTNVRVEVRGGGTTNSFLAGLFTDSNAADLFYIRTDGLINTGTKSVSPYNNSTTGRSMVVESSGGLGYLVSTRESKANIKSITNIDFISKLNPVQFNYRKKDNTNNTFTNEVYDNITYGFIADEVEKVNKELVFYNNNNSLAGVEYNSIIAILTKAVQELKQELDILKNK
jgi:hypothetical protein